MGRTLYKQKQHKREGASIFRLHIQFSARSHFSTMLARFTAERSSLLPRRAAHGRYDCEKRDLWRYTLEYSGLNPRRGTMGHLLTLVHERRRFREAEGKTGCLSNKQAPIGISERPRKLERKQPARSEQGMHALIRRCTSLALSYCHQQQTAILIMESTDIIPVDM